MKAWFGNRFARAGAVAAIALFAAACGDLTGTGNRDLEILWPREGAVLVDEEMLQARLRGWDLEDYEIYWSVDDSREYRMWDEWDGSRPYKADVVDTWYWDWNGRGPYEIEFIAEDYGGRQLARRTVRVYVE